jgi:hypothetical protein
MAKLNSKKQKKSSFYEKKSLVGLTPDLKFTKLFKQYLKIFVTSSCFYFAVSLNRTLICEFNNSHYQPLMISALKKTLLVLKISIYYDLELRKVSEFALRSCLNLILGAHLIYWLCCQK